MLRKHGIYIVKKYRIKEPKRVKNGKKLDELGSNQWFEIFRYFVFDELIEISKLNRSIYYKFVDFANSLPDTLEELQEKASIDKLILPDGDYMFKRENDLNQIAIYQLWCMNLNNPAYTNCDLSEIREEDELIDSVWAVYRENKMPFQFFHFLEGNTMVSYKFRNQDDYLLQENMLENYKWQMFNDD